MADNFITITIISTVLGFLSGLGVGGGSLLLLWLTAVVGIELADARCINLLFFLPSAAVACWYHKKQGRLSMGQLYPAILGGCVGAVCGSIITKMLPITLLRKLFGLLLVITGIRELRYRPKKQAS